MTEVVSFPDEIMAHMGEPAPVDSTSLETANSSVIIRQRGCFITACELTGRLTGDRVGILYSDADLTTPKLVASHIMSPVGPNEGIGGQHGVPRWANYHEFSRDDGTEGERRLVFQAKRSDNGLSFSKAFELTSSRLQTQTNIYNPQPGFEHTSLGEHLYFQLHDEQSTGLSVNGKSLDELLGDSAERNIMAGNPLFWSAFDGTALINFPEGYRIKLTAAVTGETKLGMLVWHRVGSESICFEPTAGFTESGQNDGISLSPGGEVTLTTAIELL